MILTHLFLMGFFAPTPISFSRVSRGVELGVARGCV
jgi:hypothetical protein